MPWDWDWEGHLRAYRLILRESLLQSSFPTSARSYIVHTDVLPVDICFDLLDPGMLAVNGLQMRLPRHAHSLCSRHPSKRSSCLALPSWALWADTPWHRSGICGAPSIEDAQAAVEERPTSAAVPLTSPVVALVVQISSSALHAPPPSWELSSLWVEALRWVRLGAVLLHKRGNEGFFVALVLTQHRSKTVLAVAGGREGLHVGALIQYRSLSSYTTVEITKTFRHYWPTGLHRNNRARCIIHSAG